MDAYKDFSCPNTVSTLCTALVFFSSTILEINWKKITQGLEQSFSFGCTTLIDTLPLNSQCNLELSRRANQIKILSL